MANDSYSAGNLELSILGFSEKAVQSIDVTAKSLGRLASAITKINNTQFVLAGDKLEVLFTKIARATNSINTTNLTNLASAAKSLSSISRLSNLEKMDFDKVGEGFSKLTVAITPFVNQVREAEVSLVAMDGILRKVGAKNIVGGKGGTSKGNGLLNLGKWTAVVFLARRLGRYVAEIVQAGSDYTETLNLWQVAMRENLDLADEFVNKMNKAYGISTKTVMNAQATFKNMIGSLGQISDETAYQLSETLVQMSADFSSLYNVKLESAFQKMQAMLAGQVRPIRSAGLDMTETTLYQYYQMIGGTKSMRNLTRTEKQLLSILAVYEQMGSAGALGDMTKTLNSFANQSRMMTEYWVELKTWSGLILKDLIDQSGALVFINAALITLTNIVKAIAQSRGLGEENFIDGLYETTEATNEEIDELQGKLLDFDKFRSMSGGEEEMLAIDEKVLEAITGYSSQIDGVLNKAQELAEVWTSLFVDVDTQKFTIFAQSLVVALGAIAVLLGAIVVLSIPTLITTAITKLKSLSIVSTIYNNVLKTMNLSIGQVAASIGALVASFAIVSLILNQFEGKDRQIAAWAAIIVGAIMAITSAIVAMNTAATWGTMLPVLLAGVGTAIAGVTALTPKVDMYAANGASDIKGGTMFVAGEYGKTEAVYTAGNGKTNVANVRQMEQAFYNALSRHSGEGGEPIVVQAYLDGEKVYENTTARAKARGKVWANS